MSGLQHEVGSRTPNQNEFDQFSGNPLSNFNLPSRENLSTELSLKAPSSEASDRKHENQAPNQERPRFRILPWALMGLIAVGGYSYFNGRSSREREEQELRQSLKPEDLASPITGLTNVLRSVAEALELVRAGKVVPEVRELENNFSGLFTYEFTLKLEGGRTKILQLTGLEANSAERKELLQALRAANVVVQSGPKVIDDGKAQSTWTSILPSLLFYGGMFALSIYLFRKIASSQGGALSSFMNAEAEIVKGGQLKERFKDIGGLDHIIDELIEIKQKIEALQAGEETVRLPKGTLLSGPPGVGKTMLVRALAGEVSSAFVKFDCSQLSTQFLVGSGTARVTNAFELARKLRDEQTKFLRAQPGATGREQGVTILYLDEFESIGLSRMNASRNLGSDTEHMKIVNTLLNELDGFNQQRNKNIIVFASTNNPDVLDPALLRPGRFTKTIQIELPHSPKQRLEILHALEPGLIKKRGFEIQDRKSLHYIAKITPGKSGDHLRQILEEATELATINGRQVVTKDDLFEAAQRVDSGRLQKSYLPRERQEQVAHHEHGHALTALACGIQIFLVSMLPRGNSLGRVIPDPQGLAESMASRRDYLQRVLITAGGRAAEVAHYGLDGCTNGVYGDLKQMRAIIATMISVGMLDNLYSLNLRELPVQNWKPEHHELIDKLTARSIAFSEEIMKAVGDQKMIELVKESLALNKELVGDEAQQFYTARLNPQTLERMRAIAKTFLEDPLGSKEGNPST